jgi:aspartyl-tRNA synthetase
MVAGFEKYFQIVRCFRDEDTRGDRQSEFTQLDIEMSFIEKEDILDLIENLFIGLVKDLFPEKKIGKKPFPRITHKEAMEKYNSDRPDLRKDKKDPNELAFAFIVDFPMFEKKQDGSLGAVHHPFTRIRNQESGIKDKDPLSFVAEQYDLVLNGEEIGGGSIREHKPEVLETVFEVLGHSKEEIKNQFGHLLDAFKYGVPPHGGIALGLDRLIMILRNEPNIREVIAFPKTGDGRDLMMNAPSEISKEQLDELGLEIKKER